MENDFVNRNDSNEPENKQEVSSGKIIEKVNYRKRKILKNNPLPITAAIVLVALLSIFAWKLFFDRTVTGEWNYISESEVADTYDTAESGDTPETDDTATVTVKESVTYEFKTDGTCTATVGTVTVPGTYGVGVDENGRNILSVSIIYDYTPVLYGNYPYRIEGNIFTGRRFVFCDDEGNALLTLERGRSQNQLDTFDEYRIADKLIGEWRNNDAGATYRFDDDGYMYLYVDGGLEYKMAYTVVGDDLDQAGTVLCKFLSAGEQSYSYPYMFVDGVLYFNNIELTELK